MKYTYKTMLLFMYWVVLTAAVFAMYDAMTTLPTKNLALTLILSGVTSASIITIALLIRSSK